MSLSYHSETDTLRINIDVQPREIDQLNEEEDLLALLRETAKSVYRFSGDVPFDDRERPRVDGKMSLFPLWNRRKREGISSNVDSARVVAKSRLL